jgi:hypothetical protein
MAKRKQRVKLTANQEVELTAIGLLALPETDAVLLPAIK